MTYCILTSGYWRSSWLSFLLIFIFNIMIFYALKHFFLSLYSSGPFRRPSCEFFIRDGLASEINFFRSASSAIAPGFHMVSYLGSYCSKDLFLPYFSLPLLVNRYLWCQSLFSRSVPCLSFIFHLSFVVPRSIYEVNTFALVLFSVWHLWCRGPFPRLTPCLSFS